MNDLAAVVQTAVRLYKRMPRPDMLNAVEAAMDELCYEGDACLDDVVNEATAALTKKPKPTAEEEEAAQLQAAQARMDALALRAKAATKAAVTAGVGTICEDWDPEPAAPNPQWDETLRRLDELSRRVTFRA